MAAENKLLLIPIPSKRRDRAALFFLPSLSREPPGLLSPPLPPRERFFQLRDPLRTSLRVYDFRREFESARLSERVAGGRVPDTETFICCRVGCATRARGSHRAKGGKKGRRERERERDGSTTLGVSRFAVTKTRGARRLPVALLSGMSS